MLHALIPDRRVLRLGGAEARGFLQDLVTNDVTPAAQDRAVYAALLTPQGKFLSDFMILADGPEDLLLDVAAAHAAPLAQRLGLYRLRRKLTIEDAGLGVALLWGDAPSAPQGARLVADPRHPDLCARLYAADPAAAVAVLGAAPATQPAWTARRIALGVPETDLDLTPETYILEAGFERLHGVDFRKGCFVGQEVVARMKHKTTLRKGLVRVRVSGEAPPPGTEVLTADGKPAGALHSAAGGEGLAHLRHDRAEGPLIAGAATLHRID